jgi:hypothetical protein
MARGRVGAETSLVAAAHEPRATVDGLATAAAGWGHDCRPSHWQTGSSGARSRSVRTADEPIEDGAREAPDAAGSGAARGR